jgi:hypothetical protein
VKAGAKRLFGSSDEKQGATAAGTYAAASAANGVGVPDMRTDSVGSEMVGCEAGLHGLAGLRRRNDDVRIDGLHCGLVPRGTRVKLLEALGRHPHAIPPLVSIASVLSAEKYRVGECADATNSAASPANRPLPPLIRIGCEKCEWVCDCASPALVAEGVGGCLLDDDEAETGARRAENNNVGIRIFTEPLDTRPTGVGSTLPKLVKIETGPPNGFEFAVEVVTRHVKNVPAFGSRPVFILLPDDHEARRAFDMHGKSTTAEKHVFSTTGAFADYVSICSGLLPQGIATRSEFIVAMKGKGVPIVVESDKLKKVLPFVISVDDIGTVTIDGSGTAKTVSENIFSIPSAPGVVIVGLTDPLRLKQ